MVIAKAASIIRRDMFIRNEIFDDDLSRKRQTLSVSSTLLQLVSLILEGGKSTEKPSQKLSHISTNIAQLIRFNSIKQQHRGEVKQFRHSQKNEPPLPVSIALMVHVETRKKSIA